VRNKNYAASPSSLLTGLVAYWSLNSVWTDLTGRGNDLTPAAGAQAPTFAAGKISNAAVFDTTAYQYSSRSSTADLAAGNVPFTVDGWFKPGAAVARYQVLIGKGNESSFARIEYMLEVSLFSQLKLTVSNGISGGQVINTTPFIVGVWCYFCFMHDPDLDIISLSINNGAPETAIWSTGVNSTAEIFYMGNRLGSWPTDYYLDGMLDEVGFWKRLLTPAEVAARYNGGAGNTYPF
jgi:hypothetical protein